MSRVLNGGKAPKLYDRERLLSTNKPRLLDLFCGAGGSARGFQDTGYYVVGVDNKWQANYCGDEFVHADAITWLRENLAFVTEHFVAINASPPCQAYSLLTNDHRVHPKLVEKTRELCLESRLPYIIENVKGYDTGLINPIMLCGSSFGLRVRRHRLFETNFDVSEISCDHAWQDADPRFLIQDHRQWQWKGFVHVYGEGGGKAREYWPYAMGCGSTWNNCWMTPYELSQAIPPAYTAYISYFIPNAENRHRIHAEDTSSLSVQSQQH